MSDCETIAVDIYEGDPIEVSVNEEVVEVNVAVAERGFTGPEGPQGPEGSQANITSLELLLAYDAASVTHFKELSQNKPLDLITIWEDDTKALKMYTKELSYTSGKLTQIVTTDVRTGDNLTKTLSYTPGGKLLSIAYNVVGPTAFSYGFDEGFGS